MRFLVVFQFDAFSCEEPRLGARSKVSEREFLKT